MKKTAVVFAGQGSQYVGMGKDFYEKYEVVRSIYQRASEILNVDVKELCFEQNEEINQTIYTQPAVLVTSLGIYTALMKEINVPIDVVAGFSLGEYSALNASGIFDFDTIIYLIKQRAALMNEAALNRRGAMAAIIGMDRDVLSKICEEIEKTMGLVRIANYNCPNQLVVSGEYDAVYALVEVVKTKGARRAVMLNVSGGFHTPLMALAAQKMYDVVKTVQKHEPRIPIIMNCTADYLDFTNLSDLMKQQIESSVYFEDTVRRMISDGVETFIEIGPGSVLSGFIKKIDNTKTVYSIDKLTDLDKLKDVF